MAGAVCQGKLWVEQQFQQHSSGCSNPLVLYCCDKQFRMQAHHVGGRFMLSVKTKEERPCWARQLPCFADFDRRVVTYGEEAVLRVLAERNAQMPIPDLRGQRRRKPLMSVEECGGGQQSIPQQSGSSSMQMSSDVQERFLRQIGAFGGNTR